MFSFRTTPLNEQPDLALNRGRVGLLCNQTAWNPRTGRYLAEEWAETGRLVRLFCPEDGFFGERNGAGPVSAADPGLHLPDCEWVCLSRQPDELEEQRRTEAFRDLDALVIELQDVGSRYFQVPNLLYSLFRSLHRSGATLSVYVADRENPAGRLAEGTLMRTGLASAYGPEGIPHRYGLTVGELANLFYTESGARFPLHIISYAVHPAARVLMPWSVPPGPDFPGVFTAQFCSGTGLWSGTNVCDGRGTTRPFEQIGAPFMASLFDRPEVPDWNDPAHPLSDPGVWLRRTRFVPVSGRWAGRLCSGFQLLPNPAGTGHTVARTLRMMRLVRERCPEFLLSDPEADGPATEALFGDPVLTAYVAGDLSWEDLREHIKVEEQKWIRKAKRHLLYDEPLWRIKSI